MTTLSQSANERSSQEMAARRLEREAQRLAAPEADAQGNAGGDEDPPGNGSANNAPGGGGNAGGGATGRGSGDGDPDNSDSESESDEMDEDEDEEPKEDPSTGQQGKEYHPKTNNGKAMAKMFVSFCQLSRANARAIVVFFGVSSSNKLADFQEAH